MHGKSYAVRERPFGSSYIKDSADLRFVGQNRHNAINRQRNSFNRENSGNEQHTAVRSNKYTDQFLHKIKNGVAKSEETIVKDLQFRLTTNLDYNDNLKKTFGHSSPKQYSNHPIKNHQNKINCKNNISQFANANGESVEKKHLPNDMEFHIAANLRQLLRPTVIEKQLHSIKKIEYDAENVNGPYNFRHLLRPTGYLPTESLRKRKGELVSNGVPLPKDKIPEKHIKRKAPLPPNQHKLPN